MEKRNSSWRRVAAIVGGGGDARRRGLRERERFGRHTTRRSRSSALGRRSEQEVLPGDGRAVGGARPATRSSTPVPAASGAYLTTGVASGILPDLAGLPGPGEMAAVRHRAARSSRSTASSTSPPTRPTPCRRSSTSGRSTARSSAVFIKGAVKGFIWYNKAELRRAPPPANWDAVMATESGSGRIRSGASGSSRAPTPAGRAPTGSRTSSSASPAPTCTTPGSPAPRSGPIPRSSRRSRPSATVLDDLVRRQRPSSTARTSAAAATDCSPSPPGCLFHHQASFITDFFKSQGGAGTATSTSSSCRTSTPSSPVRSPAAATCSACSRTRRRPRTS